MSRGYEHVPLTEAAYYILLALYTPRHGYGIMQFVREISQGRVQLGPGTLYGALKTMQEKGWIALHEAKDSRKKEYRLTPLGKEVVMAEMERLEELLKHGRAVLGGEKVDS